MAKQKELQSEGTRLKHPTSKNQKPQEQKMPNTTELVQQFVLPTLQNVEGALDNFGQRLKAIEYYLSLLVDKSITDKTITSVKEEEIDVNLISQGAVVPFINKTFILLKEQIEIVLVDPVRLRFELDDKFIGGFKFIPKDKKKDETKIIMLSSEEKAKLEEKAKKEKIPFNSYVLLLDRLRKDINNVALSPEELAAKLENAEKAKKIKIVK